MDEERDPGAEESAYDLLQRGTVLLAGRHHTQAAIVLERADRLEPDRASILEALGRAYFNAGRHGPAKQVFERLLEIDPSAHYAHFAMGQSLRRLGDPDAAGTHLRLAVALDPTSALYGTPWLDWDRARARRAGGTPSAAAWRCWPQSGAGARAGPVALSRAAAPSAATR